LNFKWFQIRSLPNLWHKSAVVVEVVVERAVEVEWAPAVAVKIFLLIKHDYIIINIKPNYLWKKIKIN
jgi:hypothetical protein